MRRQDTKADKDLEFDFAHRHIVIQKRYETLHILNDIAIGIWFLVGSLLFFFDSLESPAIWLFVIGSAHMMVRPIIRIIHKIHIGRTTKQK